MRALVQRVSGASVAVGEEILGKIGVGLVVMVGVSRDDLEEDAFYITDKVLNLRILPDIHGKFDRSIREAKGELLIVSQFTLYGDTRKGRRPNFAEAAPPDYAENLFNYTVGLFSKSGLLVETGCFKTHMVVVIHNDGPVSILLDSSDRKSTNYSKIPFSR